MNSSLLNIKTCFNLSSSPKGFVVTDNTDYASQGIALADVVGIITAKDPSGNIFYQNTDYLTPDVDLDVSLDSQEIQLPLDLAGDVKRGGYEIIYSIQVAGTDVYSKSFEYDFTFDLPTASLDFTVNVNAAQVTSTDTTEYGQYLTSLTRLQTVKYPQSLNPAIPDEVSNLEVFIVGAPIYTKTWTSVLESTVEFTLADGLCVTAVLKAVQDLDVKDNKALCDSMDCIKALYESWKEAKCNNPREASRLEQKVIEVSALYVQAKEFEICGDTTKSQAACKLIVDIVAAEGCECGCSDDDSEPQQILPLYGSGGSGGSVIVQSGGNGILVSSNTVGSTTTYTLLLDDNVLGSSGTKWFSGSGAPASDLGNEGDYYIDTSSAQQTYYKKTDATTWTVQGELKGADGADGASITSSITYDGANPLSCINFGSTNLNDVLADIVGLACQNASDVSSLASQIGDLTDTVNTNTSNIEEQAVQQQSTADELADAQTDIVALNSTYAPNGTVREQSFESSDVGLNSTLASATGGVNYGVDAKGESIALPSTEVLLQASKDNYLDADSSAIYNTAVNVGDPAPALPAGRVRLYKKTTNATDVVATEDLRDTSFVDSTKIKDASVTTAKLDSITTGKSTVSGGVSVNFNDQGRVVDIVERFVRVIVTPAQLATAHTTPVQLIEGLSNLFIDPISIRYEYVHDSAAYNAAIGVSIKNNTSSVDIFQLPSGVVSTAQNQNGKAAEVDSNSAELRYIQGQDLVLEASGDLGSTGDGYLALHIKYILMNDTLLSDVTP